jgi:hypothetical protein
VHGEEDAVDHDRYDIRISGQDTEDRFLRKYE